VEGAERDRYWCAWTMHCRLYSQNDRCVGLPPHNIEDMLLTFAVAMWEGQIGLGRQIKVQSVQAGLRAISQKYVLDAYINPRCTSPAQHALNLPIAHLIKIFGATNIGHPSVNNSRYCNKVHLQPPPQGSHRYDRDNVLLPPLHGLIHLPMQTANKTHNPTLEM
jgi:hypothetical protein